MWWFLLPDRKTYLAHAFNGQQEAAMSGRNTSSVRKYVSASARRSSQSTSDRTSSCQPRLAQAFCAALKVLRVLERKDAAAAFNGECGIELECLLPRLPAFLRSSKVAIAGREQGMGNVRLRVSCEPLLERGNRLLIIGEGKVRIGEKLEQDFRVVRVQQHRSIKRLERAFRVAGKYLDMRHQHEEVD